MLCTAAAASFGVAALSYEQNDSPPTVAASTLHLAVCDALNEARGGDAAAAGGSSPSTHEGLHQLAADTSEQDRAAAADLLEAKQKVEAALIGPAPQLAADLERLEPTVRRALAVTDADADPPSACAEKADRP